ncbi:hypothetical protein KI387_010852, partial [Taxus chinensis]
NEKGEIVRDELESIVVDIPEKEEATVNDWQALEAEIKEEYPELIIQVAIEDTA